MFFQLFSLQNKSFLCLQHVENKGFQTVIKHRLKAIQKPIKNELGNREKNTENAHFVLKKCTFRFRDYITWVFRMSFVVSVFLKSLLLFYKVVLNLAGLVERKNIHKFVPCHEESKCKRSEYGTRNG